MLLTLCYVCPPLAVLLMGRPFGMMLNMFMIFGGWNNMVKHALVCYADRRGAQYTGKMTSAINAPAWTKNQQKSLPEPKKTALIDSPYVGAKGTRFKRK